MAAGKVEVLLCSLYYCTNVIDIVNNSLKSTLGVAIKHECSVYHLLKHLFFNVISLISFIPENHNGVQLNSKVLN